MIIFQLIFGIIALIINIMPVVIIGVIIYACKKSGKNNSIHVEKKGKTKDRNYYSSRVQFDTITSSDDSERSVDWETEARRRQAQEQDDWELKRRQMILKAELQEKFAAQRASGQTDDGSWGFDTGLPPSAISTPKKKKIEQAAYVDVEKESQLNDHINTETLEPADMDSMFATYISPKSHDGFNVTNVFESHAEPAENEVRFDMPAATGDYAVGQNVDAEVTSDYNEDLSFGFDDPSEIETSFDVDAPSAFDQSIGVDKEKEAETKATFAEQSTFNSAPTSFDIKPASFDIEPASFDVGRSTFDLSPSTFDVGPSTFDVEKSSFETEKFSFDIDKSTSVETSVFDSSSADSKLGSDPTTSDFFKDHGIEIKSYDWGKGVV